MPGPYAPTDARNYVGCAKQSVRGTGLAPTFWVPYTETVDLDHRQVINNIFEAGGFGTVGDTEKVSHIPTGGFVMTARPSTAARLVALLLGSDTPSGVGPFTHVIVDDPNTDYVSVEQNLADDLTERFVDAIIAEATFRCSMAAPKLRSQFVWAGGRPSIVSPTAESYDAEEAFVMQNATFTVDGGAGTNVQSFELTVRMKMELVQIAKVVAEWVVKLGVEATLNVVQFAEDIDTEYRKSHYGSAAGTTHSETPITGSFIADFVYGSGASLRECKLEIPSMDWGNAVYTPLAGDSSEATRVTRPATAVKVAGSPLFRYTGQTADSGAYV